MLTSIKSLLGKSKIENVPNEPWDVVKLNSVQLPVWRSKNSDGSIRYNFGFSRPYQLGGKEYWAKTFGSANLDDLVGGIAHLALKLAEREDIKLQERESYKLLAEVLERALRYAREERAGSSYGNGHAK